MPKIKAKIDPTVLLPEEPMCYEIKKKKKTKKDPLGESLPIQNEDTVQVNIKQEFKPEYFGSIEVKVENIEIPVDCTELLENGMESENSQDINEGNSSDLEPQQFMFDTNTFFPPMEAATTHICNLCNLVFSNKNTLKTHKRRTHDVYKNGLPYKCMYCDVAYDKQASLKVHIKRKHLKKTPEDDKEIRLCDICSCAFVGKSRLSMHKHRKHGAVVEDFKYECKACGLSYGKQSSLTAHLQRKHNSTKETITQLFKCPFCPKSFYVKASLMTHVKRNHKLKEEPNDIDLPKNVSAGVNTYGDVICEVCKLTFVSTKKLKIHMQRAHDACKDIFKIKCNICNLSYEKIASLRRHLQRKHDQNSYCEVCQKQFYSFDLYLNHTHKKDVYDCTQCGMIFESQRAYNRHISAKHADKANHSVFCDTCGKGFKELHVLKNHLKLHADKQYPCEKCHKCFKTLDSLRHHVRTHRDVNGVIVRSCSYCDKKFSDERELCNHISSDHIQNIKQDCAENMFNCTKCVEAFPTWVLLNSHNNSVHLQHSDDASKWTTCIICEEKVASKNLNRHIKTHVNFKCHYCEFETKTSNNFAIHMLEHDADILKCGAENCYYTTDNASKLVIHIKTHTNKEEKFQCQYCPYIAESKYLIKYHENEHINRTTGKRIYKCETCPYTTFLRPNYYQHKTKHLSDKKFECEICLFKTKYYTSLKYHVRTKHQGLFVTTAELGDDSKEDTIGTNLIHEENLTE